MKTSKSTRIISTIIIVLFLAIMVFPFFWILVTSFKPGEEIFGKTAFQIIANNPTVQNFKTVIEKDILNSIINPNGGKLINCANYYCWHLTVYILINNI